jgi:hypothetical protein
MVISLTKSMPTVFNLVLFALTTIIITGLITTKSLKGMYNKCFDYDNGFEVEDKWQCMDVGGNWIAMDFNYDNIINAMFNLFVIANTEGISFYSKNYFFLYIYFRLECIYDKCLVSKWSQLIALIK